MMQANLQPTPRQPSPETTSLDSLENAFTVFSPLPLRPRGTLELLDVSIKVYKQYFAVLMGWSVLVVTGSMFASVAGLVVPFGGSLSSVLLTPLMTGVVACCVAAGVRGQRVEFSQCWHFTKPRFWPMVGVNVLAFLITMLALIGFSLVGALIGGLGFLLFRNAAENAQLVLVIIGGFVFLTVGTVFGTLVLAWWNLVPVIICMEPDKMNARALGRSYELIRGQWMKAFTLLTLLGFGITVLYVILWGAAALIIGIPEIKGILNGQTIDTEQWAVIAGFVLFNGVLYIIYRPIFSLIMTLFYLDMRVRNEALDLEWNAHVTAPRMAALAVPPSATSVQLPTGFAAANPAPPAAPNFNSYQTAPVSNDTPATYASPPAVVAPPERDFFGGFAAPPAQGSISQTASPQPGVATPLAAVPASSPGTIAPPPETQSPLNEVAAVSVAPQAQTITCPKCATPAPASYLFCMKCGTRLRAAEPGPHW